MDPDATQPCLPPVVELDEQDLDEGPWAGFADEVRHLVTEADYAALGLTQPPPPPTDCVLAPGIGPHDTPVIDGTPAPDAGR